MNEFKHWHNLINNSDKLRKFILDNPDLPILIFAGEEANSGDYSWMSCSDVNFEVGEVLDVEGPNDEKIYLEREELEEDLADKIYDEYGELYDIEYEERLAAEMLKYDPYWVKCIIIWATN